MLLVFYRRFAGIVLVRIVWIDPPVRVFESTGEFVDDVAEAA